MFMDVNTTGYTKELKGQIKISQKVKEGDPLDNETKMIQQKDGKKNVWRRKKIALDVKHTTLYSGDNVTGWASNAASGISLQ